MQKSYYRQRRRTNFRQSSRGRFSNRNRRGSNKIDISKFINKAEAEEVVVFVPENKFTDFPIEEQLKDNILARGFEDPTPIQDKAILPALEGKDVVGIANTGTGKTGAFLIPLVDKVLKDPTENILILTPTRELAQQIDNDLWEFTKKTPIFAVCAVGGVPIDRQLSGLKRGCNFIVGTPGRVKDLLDRGVIDLSTFNSVVLDEADRMLDMGFIDDMREILDELPAKRQTLFFSATFSGEIKGLIGEFLNNPEMISVKSGDTAKTIDQDVIRVGEDENKFEVLRDLLGQEGFSKVLIFGETKRGVEDLMRNLRRAGVSVYSIHGDKTQRERERALDSFKEEAVQVLVATDVAARGLDIANVTHVINYDLPGTEEDYIHRIGRTGRGGQKGKALTFIK